MKIKVSAKKTTSNKQLSSELINACAGKAEGKKGLNVKEFRRELKISYPEYVTAIDNARTRNDLETLCKQLMSGAVVVNPVVEEENYHELPKEYCEDYTLEELTAKSGRQIHLTANDREKICQELGIPKYNLIDDDSLGYPRTTILAIVNKINSNSPLSETEKRIVTQWNRNHDPIKERIDDLARRFVNGETLSQIDLKFLDKELFNKYCRCVLKRKRQDSDLFAERNLEKILKKIPDQNMAKANEIVQTEMHDRTWNQLTTDEQNALLAKLMPIYLGLSIGGCKASVYQKTRRIKPRNRECDYELRQAEITLEPK